MSLTQAQYDQRLAGIDKEWPESEYPYMHRQAVRELDAERSLAPAPEKPAKAARNAPDVLSDRREAIRLANPNMPRQEANSAAARQLLEDGEQVRMTLTDVYLLPEDVRVSYKKQFTDGKVEYADEQGPVLTPKQKLVKNEPMTADEWRSLGMEPPTDYDPESSKLLVAELGLRTVVDREAWEQEQRNPNKPPESRESIARRLGGPMVDVKKVRSDTERAADYVKEWRDHGGEG